MAPEYLKKCPRNRVQAYIERVLLPLTVCRVHDLVIIVFSVSSPVVKTVVDIQGLFSK